MAPWPTEAPGAATPGEDRDGMPSPAARNGARADHGGLGVPQDATGAQRSPSEPSVAPDEVARRRAEHERAERERLRRRHFDNEQIRRDVKRELDLRELVDPPDAETRRVRLTKASDFKIKAVRWVWAGRMPMGEITLIPGREGVGKSTFLAWLAAKLTKGELPGVWDGTKRAVLYAATEDSWEHTIAPRMLAAGADMDLVYRVDVQVVEGKYGKLLLPTDVMELTTAALDVEAAALMCDPVISVLADRINTFKAQELRSALEPLRMAAERAELAVAGLVHFNKGKDTDVLTSVSGSRAWTEVARAVVAIAKDPDADEYTCVVSQVKNNLGRSDLPHLAYTIGSATVETHDGGETEVGRLRWTSDGYARGVEDILNPPKEKKRSELHQKVIDFVIETEEETGRGVATGDVVQRFGGAASKDNLMQILSRLAREGALRKVGYGLYGAPGDGDGVVRRCPGPCEGTKLGQDENFCANCRKRLDRDSAAESSQDTLY